MKKLTVSELRAVAQILQNRPRVSAMEDPDFCASVLQLIGDTRRTFMGVKEAQRLLAHAASYASSAHIELSLAAVQAVLQKVGPQMQKERLGGSKGAPVLTKIRAAEEATESRPPATAGFSLAGTSTGWSE
jgi:hypothetical protein